MTKLQFGALRQQPYLYSTYLAKAERVLLGERSLTEVAETSYELAPATRSLHPAPVFEKADLERITGYGAGTTPEYEQQQTIATWRTHKATVAHRMRNLFLIDGGFYSMRFKHSVSLLNGPVFTGGIAPTIHGGVLAQSWLGARYFGHWLLEDIPLGLLAGRRGDAVGVNRPLSAQQQEYADFFNYHLKELPGAAFVENIEILADSGLNSFHIGRLKSLRDHFSNPTQFPRHDGVFLMRGSTGESRQLVNEPEVAELMIKRGFRVINPGLSSLFEVRQAVANARLVVGVEGSQLSHGLLGLASGGAMLVLQPPFRFNNAFKERCDLLGMTYSFLVCHLTAGGFCVDLTALERLIDRLQQHILDY